MGKEGFQRLTLISWPEAGSDLRVTIQEVQFALLPDQF
jgi:hypothetical protein